MSRIAVAAVVGYLAGSVSPAALLAGARGVDLRAAGSGNPGATNVGRVLGRRAGVAVGVLDVAKGAVPAALFGLATHDAGLAAGAAAIVGHITSPWLRGRGGKGVATAFGAILGSHPAWAPYVLVVWVVTVAATRWIALASIAAAVSVPVVAAVAGVDSVDMSWAAGIAAVVALRHYRNVARWWVQRRGGLQRSSTTSP